MRTNSYIDLLNKENPLPDDQRLALTTELMKGVEELPIPTSTANITNVMVHQSEPFMMVDFYSKKNETTTRYLYLAPDALLAIARLPSAWDAYTSVKGFSLGRWRQTELTGLYNTIPIVETP